MKKSIKKISSLALAMLMAGSIMPMAFAADTEINQDSDPKSGEVKVSYTVKETYKVSFPSEVVINTNFGTTEVGKFNIAASDIAVNNISNLKVFVTATNGNQLDLANKDNAEEKISILLGVYKTDGENNYTKQDLPVEKLFANNKGLAAGEFTVGYKLLDENQLNGKSAGTYSANVTVNVSVAAKG